MELLSRQLRLVRATGFARRRQVAVLDQAPRSGGVEGRIFRSDGSQTVDVPVKHAEHRGDQNGVVDLQISRLRRTGLGDKLSADAESALLRGRGDRQQGLQLGRHRCAGGIGADLLC
jgi:hypothetical protein